MIQHMTMKPKILFQWLTETGGAVEDDLTQTPRASHFEWNIFGAIHRETRYAETSNDRVPLQGQRATLCQMRSPGVRASQHGFDVSYS